MLERYPQDVKLVIKNFPLSRHRYARLSAAAALSANKQGKFWEFHHKLFEYQKNLNEIKIQEIAKELNLDVEQFNRDIRDPAILTLINRDKRNGYEAGVRGTPTVFINGRLLRRTDFQGFQQMIEEQLRKKKKSGS